MEILKPTKKICPYAVACDASFCEFRKPTLFASKELDCAYTDFEKGQMWGGTWWPKDVELEHITLIEIDD